MSAICSYCRKEIKQEQPPRKDGTFHIMCNDCLIYFKQQWDGLSLGEYLDRFDCPVMIVDSDVRLVAANQIMADLLHMSDREFFGLLGGEAMECVHARLPEGCGKTVHCSTCALRISINHTFSTGEPLDNVPASISAENETIRFQISTRMINDGEGVEAVHVLIRDLDNKKTGTNTA
jgi:hypothetical protein